MIQNTVGARVVRWGQRWRGAWGKTNEAAFTARFLRTSVAAGAFSAGYSSMSIAKPAVSSQAGDRLNMASIGSGGRGGANLKEFYDLGEQIVARCDVDRGRLNHSAKCGERALP